MWDWRSWFGVDRGRVPMPVPCVDLHTHVLPGVDDGPQSMDDAVALLARAVRSGITHVVATPHYGDRFDTDVDAIAAAHQHLAAALRDAGVAITVIPGREIMIAEGRMEEVARDERLRIAHGNHALIEMPDGLNHEALIECIQTLKAAGVRPILAHPERNWMVQHRPDLATELRMRGVLVQVNASSIAGARGSTARRTAMRLFEKAAVDIVGSDAHRARDYDWYDRAISRIGRQWGAACLERTVRDVPAYVTATIT